MYIKTTLPNHFKKGEKHNAKKPIMSINAAM